MEEEGRDVGKEDAGEGSNDLVGEEDAEVVTGMGRRGKKGQLIKPK